MEWLTDIFVGSTTRTAIIDQQTEYSYGDLHKKIEEYRTTIACNVEPLSAVAILAESSFHSIALFFALFLNKQIIVPIVTTVESEIQEKISIAQARHTISIGRENDLTFLERQEDGENDLYKKVRMQSVAGLVLFSSGSTGSPKAMVHNLDNLTLGYKGRKKKGLSFLQLLMFDHIGGLNTLLNCLTMSARLVIPPVRTPEVAGRLIEQYRINVLPASPTFLNLLLMHQTPKKYDMGSIRLITYGTEIMPESLLQRLHKAFPRARFLQTFGTSETGISHTSSRSSTSLDFKIEDPNLEYKIVDGELWLRSGTQTFGYLNAVMDNFTSDGWFKTGDQVKLLPDGHIRISGRINDIINVGGEKVSPGEVESVLLEIDEILEVLVRGESNAITGQNVVAEIVPTPGVDIKILKKIIRKYCKSKLANFKVPTKITFTSKIDISKRFKKIRVQRLAKDDTPQIHE